MARNAMDCCMLRAKECRSKNLLKWERTSKRRNGYIGMKWQGDFSNSRINCTFGQLSTVAKDGSTISIQQSKGKSGFTKGQVE